MDEQPRNVSLALIFMGFWLPRAMMYLSFVLLSETNVKFGRMEEKKREEGRKEDVTVNSSLP